MAKRNGNGNGKKIGNKRERKDIPLPKTLPTDLKPYDTNNDGVLSTEERSAMRIAKNKERRKEVMQKGIDERRAEKNQNWRRP